MDSRQRIPSKLVISRVKNLTMLKRYEQIVRLEKRTDMIGDADVVEYSKSSKSREYSNSISSSSYISVMYQLCISSMSLHTVLILYLYLNKIVILSIQ